MALLLPELHQLIVYHIDELDDLLNVRLVSRAWLQYVRKVKRLVWHNDHNEHPQNGPGIMKIFPNLETVLNCRVKFPIDKLPVTLRCCTIYVDAKTSSFHTHIIPYLIELLKNGSDCDVNIENSNLFKFKVSRRELSIRTTTVALANSRYGPTARHLINAYIDWMKRPIELRLSSSLFMLPWNKLDSLDIDWMPSEEALEFYKRLVKDGKLKHFKGWMKDASNSILVPIEYKSN